MRRSRASAPARPRRHLDHRQLAALAVEQARRRARRTRSDARPPGPPPDTRAHSSTVLAISRVSSLSTSRRTVRSCRRQTCSIASPNSRGKLRGMRAGVQARRPAAPHQHELAQRASGLAEAARAARPAAGAARQPGGAPRSVRRAAPRAGAESSARIQVSRREPRRVPAVTTRSPARGRARRRGRPRRRRTARRAGAGQGEARLRRRRAAERAQQIREEPPDLHAGSPAIGGSRRGQHPPRQRAGVLAALDDHAPVDDHVVDAGSVLVRGLVGRAVADARRVERDEVGLGPARTTPRSRRRRRARACPSSCAPPARASAGPRRARSARARAGTCRSSADAACPRTSRRSPRARSRPSRSSPADGRGRGADRPRRAGTG